MPISGLAGRCIVTLLSFCVFFLALGIPTTLLSASAPADRFAASVLEGLSLTPSIVYCLQSTTVIPADIGAFSVELTVFDFSLFRPPIS
jgi:hypothetical protein